MACEMDFVDECYADKDLSLLKKLTLVIPTYNRNYYLSRCLWYHAHFPFGQIIVADSSPEEKKVVNRETVSKVREMFGVDILYLEYEPETDKYGGDIYRKWGDAIMYVKTEYSQFCADREFTLPLSLSESCKYLNEHPEYISASGGRGSLLRNRHKYILNPITENYTYSESNPLLRLLDFSENRRMVENLYSLYQSTIHKQIYNGLLENDISDIRYGECALEIQPYIIGKIKRLSSLHRVRDQTNEYIGFKGVTKKSESSASRYLDASLYSDERNKMLKSKLSSCIIALFPCSMRDNPQISDVIEKEIENLTAPWLGKSLSSGELIYNNIWRFLPHNLKLFLSRYFGNGTYSRLVQINTKDKYVSLILKIVYGSQGEYQNDEIISYLLKHEIKTT